MRACPGVWLYERPLKVLRHPVRGTGNRDGANDFRQPSENIDEGYSTPFGEGNVSFVSSRFSRSCSKRLPARDMLHLWVLSFLPMPRWRGILKGFLMNNIHEERAIARSSCMLYILISATMDVSMRVT